MAVAMETSPAPPPPVRQTFGITSAYSISSYLALHPFLTGNCNTHLGLAYEDENCPEEFICISSELVSAEEEGRRQPNSDSDIIEHYPCPKCGTNMPAQSLHIHVSTCGMSFLRIESPSASPSRQEKRRRRSASPKKRLPSSTIINPYDFRDPSFHASTSFDSSVVVGPQTRSRHRSSDGRLFISDSEENALGNNDNEATENFTNTREQFKIFRCRACREPILGREAYKAHMASEHRRRCDFCNTEMSRGQFAHHKCLRKRLMALKPEPNDESGGNNEPRTFDLNEEPAAPFSCIICGAGDFPTLATLRYQHVIQLRSSHRLSEIVSCPVPCGKRLQLKKLNRHIFRCKASLRSRLAHMLVERRSSSSNSSGDEDDEPEYTCEKCGIIFAMRSSLLQHNQSVHSRKLPSTLKDPSHQSKSATPPLPFGS